MSFLNRALNVTQKAIVVVCAATTVAFTVNAAQGLLAIRRSRKARDKEIDEMAENLKKQSAFIPGLRPGKATAEYIDAVLTRITVGGALYVAAVVTVPTLLQSRWKVPFYLGGSSLMIVAGVAREFA